MIESEKVLERKLFQRVKALGGWALKMPAIHVSGLPDRICLLPGGRVIFVEVKTTGQKPRRIQEAIHKKLKDLGFRVEVVDSSLKLKEVFG